MYAKISGKIMIARANGVINKPIHGDAMKIAIHPIVKQMSTMNKITQNSNLR
jgi:hypothetical protein